MVSVNYWIQSADASTTDGRAESGEQAIAAFAHHDWELELRRCNELERQGQETVPPGIGYHFGDSAPDLLLHICPNTWDNAQVYYQYTGKMKRLFGLLSPADIVASTIGDEFPTDQIARAINLFLDRDHDALVALLESGGRRP